MKKLAKCTILVLVAVVVWSLCLAKYFDSQSGFAVNGITNKLIFKVPYLPHISSYFNGSQYEFHIYNTCTLILLAVLVLWRILLLRNFWTRPS